MEPLASTALARGYAPSDPHLTPGPTDEALVADARAGLTPAEMVERKVAWLLKSQPLPVSHLMTARRTGRDR